MQYEEYDIDELLDDIDKLLGDEPKKPAPRKKASGQKKPAASPKQPAPQKKKTSGKAKPKSKASPAKKKSADTRRKKPKEPKGPSVMARFRSDLARYFGYAKVSARAQLKSEVANSYLNWVWWVLEPLSFMLIYAYIFGTVFNAREQYFSVFIYLGLTLWNFFERTLKGSVKIVKVNKSIVSKVYFPKFVLILTKMMVNGFKMFISLALIAGMIAYYQVPVSRNLLYALPILMTLGVLTFGCSCFLLHYGVYVEDLSNVVSILLKVVYFLTGIFYHVEKKIPQWGELLTKVNPMAFLLDAMRQCTLYNETPNWLLLIVWFAVGVILSILGVRKIYKEENSYVKAI